MVFALMGSIDVVLLVRNRITVSEVIVSNEWSLYCESFSSTNSRRITEYCIAAHCILRRLINSTWTCGYDAFHI